MKPDAQEILLVGAGQMAVHYAKVLQALGMSLRVFGRGAESARVFEEKTGCAPSTGPLEEQIGACERLPDTAIVTVNAQYLSQVTAMLANAGVRRLLVEKPAALDLEEMDGLLQAVAESGAEIFLGYNRRFMASVLRAEEYIKADGGVLSVKADFSEPSRRIATLDKPQRELDTWFYGNSSHVIDLAFYFFGEPVRLAGDVSGSVSWHPAAGVFAGSASNAAGAMLSWHANWLAPGRWGLEVMTPENRLILQPLEKLRVQSHESFEEKLVELDDEDDRMFKPGLLRQVRAFLFGEDAGRLPRLDEHARHMRFYDIIRTGGELSR